MMRFLGIDDTAVTPGWQQSGWKYLGVRRRTPGHDLDRTTRSSRSAMEEELDPRAYERDEVVDGEALGEVCMWRGADSVTHRGKCLESSTSMHSEAPDS